MPRKSSKVRTKSKLKNRVRIHRDDNGCIDMTVEREITRVSKVALPGCSRGNSTSRSRTDSKSITNTDSLSQSSRSRSIASKSFSSRSMSNGTSKSESSYKKTESKGYAKKMLKKPKKVENRNNKSKQKVSFSKTVRYSDGSSKVLKSPPLKRTDYEPRSISKKAKKTYNRKKTVKR